MNTKTCKRCGWVYPITQPGKKCRICGEPFDIVVCYSCGKPHPLHEMVTNTLLCKSCRSKNVGKSIRNRKARMRDRFDQWLEKVKKIPDNYPTLTEAQWLEACKYFNGCARCTNDEIDTRGFFIGREQGGRYCDWNVIPLCTRCAKMWQLDRSMFVYAYHKDLIKNDSRYRPLGASDSTSEFRDCLEKIVEYLEVKLNNAIKVSENIGRSTE